MLAANLPQLLVMLPAGNYLIATFQSPALKNTHLRWLRFLLQWVICAAMLALYLFQTGWWDKLRTIDLGVLLCLFVFGTTLTYIFLRDTGVANWEAFTTYMGKLLTSGLPGRDQETDKSGTVQYSPPPSQPSRESDQVRVVSPPSSYPDL
jgi:hypothetical protein